MQKHYSAATVVHHKFIELNKMYLYVQLIFFLKLGLTSSKLSFGHEIRGSHISFFIQKERENENSANHSELFVT